MPVMCLHRIAFGVGAVFGSKVVCWKVAADDARSVNGVERVQSRIGWRGVQLFTNQINWLHNWLLNRDLDGFQLYLSQ